MPTIAFLHLPEQDILHTYLHCGKTHPIVYIFNILYFYAHNVWLYEVGTNCHLSAVSFTLEFY